MIWYASCADGMPSMFWSMRLCAWLHCPAKTCCRICASAPAPRGLLWSYGPPAQMVSSLSCSRSVLTLPNTMAPRRPLPSGSARSQSVPALASYHSARSFAARTSAGATDAGLAAAVHCVGNSAAPAPAALSFSTCLRDNSDICVSPPSHEGDACLESIRSTTGPLLVGAAVAGPDLDLGAVSGAGAGDVQALGAVDAQLT